MLWKQNEFGRNTKNFGKRISQTKKLSKMREKHLPKWPQQNEKMYANEIQAQAIVAMLYWISKGAIQEVCKVDTCEYRPVCISHYWQGEVKLEYVGVMFWPI